MKVSKLRDAGTYADGDGLYLTISKTGARSWFFRYVSNGRAREMGLGSAHNVGLAEARDRAAHLRRQRREGIDPAEARRAEKIEAKRERASGMTFEECATRFLEAKRGEWANEKHAAQWGSTLDTYAFPVIGNKSVAAIGVDEVLSVLEPIWRTKNETASRVRGRIESILNYAKVRGWRSGENPASWSGNLQNALPSRSSVSPVRHHAAMPYADLPNFLTKLRLANGVAPLALEFLILTAARTGEVIGATWPEISSEGGLWHVAAKRMKARREHRVPLSGRARAILEQMAERGTGGFVFRGTKEGRGLSNMAMDKVLRSMNIDCTVHGFRSSFRDWAGNETTFPRELAEAALAHIIGDKAEQAYRRGDALERRRAMMTAWAVFLEGAA